MRRVIMLMVCLICIGGVAEAQMPTDNSYVRQNYQNSKTAKKRALKKAQRTQRKAQKKAAKNAGKQTAETKALELSQKSGYSSNEQKSKTANAYTGGQKSKTTYNAFTEQAGNNHIGHAGSNDLNTENTLYWDAAEPYYMEGALQKEGKKVVFEKQIAVGKGVNEEQAIRGVVSVVSQIIAHTEDTKISRIDTVATNMVKAVLCEPVYFKQKKWVTDSTLIRYTFVATYKEGKVEAKATNINYSYESGSTIVFDYPAEEWITDEYALSKDKKALAKNAGRFRVKTIDYFRDLYGKLADILAGETKDE